DRGEKGHEADGHGQPVPEKPRGVGRPVIVGGAQSGERHPREEQRVRPSLAGIDAGRGRPDGRPPAPRPPSTVSPRSPQAGHPRSDGRRDPGEWAERGRWPLPPPRSLRSRPRLVRPGSLLSIPYGGTLPRGSSAAGRPAGSSGK